MNTETPLLDLIDARPNYIAKILKRYVVTGSGCWNWTGTTRQSSIHSRGEPYGAVTIRNGGDRKTLCAHRLAYAYHNDKDPEGSVVRHKCDNTLCINPDHLLTGTQSDNMSDCLERGRATGAKLTEQEVKFIISRLNQNSNEELARHIGYKVQAQTIREIRSGRAWKHLPREIAA